MVLEWPLPNWHPPRILIGSQTGWEFWNIGPNMPGGAKVPVAIVVMEIRPLGVCMYSCGLRGVYIQATHAQDREKHVSLLHDSPLFFLSLCRGGAEGGLVARDPAAALGEEQLSRCLLSMFQSRRDPLPFRLLGGTCRRKALEVYCVNSPPFLPLLCKQNKPCACMTG